MFDFQSPHFLRRILWLDTATCVATGLLMTVAAGPIAGLTQLPAPLLRYAGLSLLPVAAFIASVASRPMLPAAGVWLIIAGNFAWVAASLWLWLGAGLAPNTLGTAFILIQAAAVAVLAELEYTGLKRSQMSAA